MEERPLSEKESLELITRMIKNTHQKLEEGNGIPFLVWGYTSVIVSLLVWYMLTSTQDYHWNFLWFLIPLVGFPVQLFLQRKREKGIKNVSGKYYQICLDRYWCSRFCSFYGCHVLLENTHFVYYYCTDGYRNGNYRNDYSVQADNHIRIFKHPAIFWLPDFQSVLFNTDFCTGIFTDDGNPRAYIKLQKP